jgi:hypothetical protein
MRWAGQVVSLWEMRSACRILVGKFEGTEDGIVVLKWMLEKWGLRLWSALSWMRIGRAHRRALVNKRYIKSVKFLDLLSEYGALKHKVTK